MNMNNISVKAANLFDKKFRSKVLFYFLCVTAFLVLIIVYNSAGADKKNALLKQEAIDSVGAVTGIFHNETNPTALIGVNLAHEGEVVSGAKVVKIHKDRVDFEKDEFTWTQNVTKKCE